MIYTHAAAALLGASIAAVGAYKVQDWRYTGQIKTSVGELQGWIVPMLCIAVVALAGYIVWQRVSQRRKGWA